MAVSREDLSQLRVAAALAHSALDADIELHAATRRWVVSYDRSDADLDPCRFRRLVAAAMQGADVGVMPRDHVVFVGALQELAAGTLRRVSDEGEERWLAACLPADAVWPLLETCPIDIPDEAMRANVKGDELLGVTVVTITANHPAFVERLDEVATWAAGACLVEELVGHVMASGEYTG